MPELARPAQSGRRRLGAVAPYVVVALLALLLGWWVLGLGGHLSTTPLTYSADGIAASVGAKGIAEHGQPYTNPSLSAPDKAAFFDFPNADSAFIALLWLITRFTRNYVLALNLFAWLTYPLIALAATWSLRRLGASIPASVAFALLYAILPFHQTRVQMHLFLSAYFVIPLAVALVADVILGTPREGERRVLGLPLWAWGTVLLIGTCGIYYAYFSCALVVLGGLIAAYRSRTLRAALPAAVVVAAVVVLLGLQLLPSYVYWHAEGRNNTGDLRQPVEADYFGLRLTQLVYPMDGHRLARFAGAKEYLHDSLELISPTMAYIAYDSSLGLVGVLGLLLLFGWMVASPFRAPPDGPNGVPATLSLIGVSSFLLGTVGGVGALIAFLAFPQIRAYDRITVVIAFASLAAVAWLFDRVMERLAGQPRERRIAVAVLLVAGVLVVGVLDQTNPAEVGPDYAAIKPQYASDQRFVRDVENALPDNARVFQLPFMAYAEATTEGSIGTYESLRLYLHAETIRWSAGAFRGRPTAAWQAETAELEPVAMIAALKAKGFAGIALDRNGYDDHGAAIEREIADALGGARPIESPDGRYAFFGLDG